MDIKNILDTLYACETTTDVDHLVSEVLEAAGLDNPGGETYLDIANSIGRKQAKLVGFLAEAEVRRYELEH